jgi:hypothetical protein
VVRWERRWRKGCGDFIQSHRMAIGLERDQEPLVWMLLSLRTRAEGVTEGGKVCGGLSPQGRVSREEGGRLAEGQSAPCKPGDQET